MTPETRIETSPETRGMVALGRVLIAIRHLPEKELGRCLERARELAGTLSRIRNGLGNK